MSIKFRLCPATGSRALHQDLYWFFPGFPERENPMARSHENLGEGAFIVLAHESPDVAFNLRQPAGRRDGPFGT